MHPAFLNSLPKSGTHLVGRILLLGGYRQRGHLGASLVLDRTFAARARRILFGIRPGTRTLVGIDTPVAVPTGYLRRWIASLAPGEFLSAHTGSADEFRRFCDAAGVKRILVVRDPRAVLNSFVFYVARLKRHHLNRLFAGIDTEARYRLGYEGIRDGAASLESLRTRYLHARSWADDPGCLVVRFEDVVGERGGGTAGGQRQGIERITAHLAVTDVCIDEIVERMDERRTATFRKGVIDSWKEEMPKAVTRRIEEEMGDILEAFGYR